MKRATVRNTKCLKCGAACFTDTDFMTHACLPYQNPVPSKHTPGPWTVSEVTKDKSEFQALVGNSEIGWVVAGVYKHPKLQFNGSEHAHVNTSSRKSQALADAHLIAAVPEMLEALKNAGNVLAALVVGDLKQVKADSPALLAIRAAIKKAEGK